jgi:FtsH-binding integral membrane protein
MDYTKFNGKSFASSNSEVHFDSGLRAYMIAVFKDMALGLAITGIIAMLVASSPAMMQTIYGTPLSWVVMFAPLVLVFYMSAKFASMETSAVRNLFYVYSATMGLSLAFIFMVYTGESIARTFFVTASTFGAMSIYGYSTKKDLTSMGSFLMMGVIGIIIASLVNIFIQSSGMSFAISILSVIIFTGLTAYDTQRIKDLYYQSGSQDVADKMGVYGALMLYMDFINIFMSLLRLFGDRRSE